MDPYKAAAMLAVAFAGIGQTLLAASPEGDFGFFIRTDDPYYLAAVSSNAAADLVATIIIANDLRKLYYGEPRTMTACYAFKGYLAVEFLQLMLGSGPPYLGDNLRDSSKQFAELSKQLEAVTPNGNWRGVAAQNYTNQVTRLSCAISDLAELDNDLATCANQHGENVSQIRAMMGLLKDLCIIACFIEAYMAITDASSAKICGIIFGSFGVFFSAIGAFLIGISSYSHVAVFVDDVTYQYKDLDPGVTPAKFSAPSSAGVTLSGMASAESVPPRLEAASSSVPASFDWTAIAKRAAKSPGYAVQLLNLVGRPEQPVRRRPAIVPTASAVTEDAESASPGLATAIAVPVAEKGLIESGVSPARSEVVNGVETAVSQGI